MNIPLKYARKFKDCWGFSEGVAKVQFEDGTYGFIDETGKNYKNIVFYNDPVGSFFKEGIIGILDEKTKKVVFLNKDFKPISKLYKQAYSFKNGFAKVMRDDGTWTYIDRNGNEKNISKKGLHNFSKDGIAITVDFSGNWSYIDIFGEEYLHGEFYSIRDFHEDVAIVNLGITTSAEHDPNERIPIYAIIDRNFRIIKYLKKYTYVGDFYDGYACCITEFNSTVYIDRNGNECIHCAEGLGFDHGCALVRDYGSNFYHYINKDGKKISKDYAFVKFSEEDYYRFEDGYSLALLPKEDITYVNAKGKEIGKHFKTGRPFACGFAAVQLKNGKWTYINTQGELVFGDYFLAHSFSDNIAIVQTEEGGPYEYINNEGRYLIDFSKLTNSQISEILDYDINYKKDLEKQKR